MATTFAGSKFSTKHVLTADDDDDEEGEEEQTEEDEEEEDSAKSGSTSSFSLQECIDEFRARRTRRVSTHSRDCDNNRDPRNNREPRTRRTMDADLINQNRCNKEQERKGKPCQNGFCYCFTSDSGDCGSTAPPRDQHVRLPRRSRRSESSKFTKQNNLGSQEKPQQPEKRRLSEPVNVKSSLTSPFTAVSRLRAVGGDSEPLIHIIQELRDNCVVSEVRVNRQKLPGASSSSCRHRNSQLQGLKATTTKQLNYEPIEYKPSAPVLSNISEQESAVEEQHEREMFAGHKKEMFAEKEKELLFAEKEKELLLAMQEKEFLSAELSSRRSSRSRRSSGGGGRLLQKRLSLSEAKYKPRDNHKPPPPKPPRCSSQSLTDGTSLTSTNPSVREAERVLDEFLRKRGVCVPVSNITKSMHSKESQRRSYPMAEVEKPRKSPRKSHLPTCPSLSDIERVVESKRGSHYARNIRQEIGRKSEASKEIILGWTEPKISDMLNYEGKHKAKEFETHAAPAEPQVPIGWQVPQPVMPKISLDTVDGSMSENLVANMEYKDTPIKYPRGIKTTGGQASQKFIWGEQWRNLSPWKGQKTQKLGTKSKNFLNNSKKKILRFVSPKKSNQQEEQPPTRTPPKLCTVGVQTSQLVLHSQSPPGSYHSPMQTTPSGTTTSTGRQQAYFDFERKVEAPTPPKKLPRANRARKLDFQAEPTATAATYRSYQKDLDHDVTINKMGYLLSSIRAKLEASDERALRTFRDCSRSDPLPSFDCTDGPTSSLATTSVATTLRMAHHQRNDSEPIYSEIEEDCLRFRGSPHHEVRTAAHLSNATSTSTPSSTAYVSATTPVESPSPADLSAMYARVQKTPKNSPQAKAQVGQMPKNFPLVVQMPQNLTEVVQMPKNSSQVVQMLKNSHQVLQMPQNLTQLKSQEIQMPKNSSQVVHSEDEVTRLVQRPKVQPKTQIVSSETPQPLITAAPKPPLALGHFLHESLKNGSFFQFMPLPEEPGSSSEISESTGSSVVHQPKLKSPPPPTHHSLNNISEKDSPPKKNRNLSRSELSLQRSEIFLDNLCRSELVLDRLEKVPNTSSHVDSVSYDLPNEGVEELYADYSSSSFVTNDYGSGHIEPEPENQSTPKKRNQQQQQQSQRFTTKPAGNLSIDINDGPATPLRPNLSFSCPTTPQQQAEQQQQQQQHQASSLHNSSSLGELPSESQLMSVSALARYRLLKDALRRSYRKGKDFIGAKKQRLAQSLNISRDQSNAGECDSSSYYTSFNLDCLLNESLSTSEQLAQAVSICRQMPQLEISSEMVEAERLLLFSSLRKAAPSSEDDAPLPGRSQCLLIDAMELPVRADVSLDMFFNYHFICTFESGGVIRSTQSVECQNGSAFFRDCGLEFYSDERSDSLELRCQIFMLRLRKVSTLSLEPAKSLRRGSGNLGSSNSNSSTGSAGTENIISRFRLHASFTLKAMDLAPFKLVASETRAGDKICLRSSSSWKFPLSPHSKSTNLGPGITLTGRVDLRLPKIHFAGYLNVQDPKSRHHWNRRWCSLDGVLVSVWQHENNLAEDSPIFSVELPGCGQSAITAAPRELCARARSFLVQGKQSEYETGVFFAADTQSELLEWLTQLNEALRFARHWLSST